VSIMRKRKTHVVIPTTSLVLKLEVWRVEQQADQGRVHDSSYLEAVLGTEVLEARQLVGADGKAGLFGGDVERLRETYCVRERESTKRSAPGLIISADNP